MLGGVYMRKLAPAWVSYQHDFLISQRVYMMTGLFHILQVVGYLKVHFMLIKCTYDSKSRTLRMRYPFQPTGRPISHRNVWSFRVYMILLRDFVLEWNSRPGATTGVNSCRDDSHWHDFLWWYHVNKCRAMRGNWSELVAARKPPQCHVNTPLVHTKTRHSTIFR